MLLAPFELLFAIVSLIAFLAVPALIALGFIILFKKNRDLQNRVEMLEREIQKK